MFTKGIKPSQWAFIGLFLLHGVEEYATRFYSIDPLLLFLSEYLRVDSRITFLLIQVIATVALACFARHPKTWLVAVVFLLLFELEHVYKAIAQGSYYSGAVTALLLPIAAYLSLHGMRK